MGGDAGRRRVEVYHLESGDFGLSGTILHAIDVLHRINGEGRAKGATKVFVEDVEPVDGCYGRSCYNITGYRPETDKEYAERIERERGIGQREADRERALYLALKAKYESGAES